MPGAAAGTVATSLELAALPSAVPCARLHTKQVLWEWGLGAHAETAELVVSELITNAIRAAGVGPGVPVVQLRLTRHQEQVLVEVWDASPQPPVRAEAGPDGESGRGLVLVQALSTRWGYYYPERPPRGRARGPVGKIVWALCG